MELNSEMEHSEFILLVLCAIASGGWRAHPEIRHQSGVRLLAVSDRLLFLAYTTGCGSALLASDRIALHPRHRLCKYIVKRVACRRFKYL